MKEKKEYLELLRAMAMLLVIFNHTGIRGFFLFSITENPILYQFYMFLSIACKVAVPLYWMISGALLLPKEESIGEVYRRRVLRMVIVLVVFSLAYYLIGIMIHQEQLGLASVYVFLIRLYTSQYGTAFWFIYSYIGMMMMLPFFRKLVKAMPQAYFHYMFVMILFIQGILPIAEYLGSTLPSQIGLPFNTELTIYSINKHITENVFSKTVLYFFGGYYFGILLGECKFTRMGMIRWGVAGLFAIVLTGLMTHYKIVLTGQSEESQAQTFYNNLICIPTFFIFYSARFLLQRHPLSETIRRIVLSFGCCSFGIMLCEEVLRRLLEPIYTALAPHIHALPACMVWVLAVYLSGYITTWCLKQIPGIKKLI